MKESFNENSGMIGPVLIMLKFRELQLNVDQQLPSILTGFITELVRLGMVINNERLLIH